MEIILVLIAFWAMAGCIITMMTWSDRDTDEYYTATFFQRLPLILYHAFTWPIRFRR